MKRYIKAHSNYYDDTMVNYNLPDIVGVTLLTVDEAKSLSRDQRLVEDIWWLRSPGYIDYEAACVFGTDGLVYGLGYNVSWKLGVRPALQIANLESSNLGLGDSFGFAGYTWTIISNDKALCDDVIGYSVFREDWEAEDANNYEASDVKKYLERWFAENAN